MAQVSRNAIGKPDHDSSGESVPPCALVCLRPPPPGLSNAARTELIAPPGHQTLRMPGNLGCLKPRPHKRSRSRRRLAVRCQEPEKREIRGLAVPASDGG